MTIKLILTLCMLLTPFTVYSASTLELPVFNDNASSHTGYVSFAGIPIHINDSTSSIDDLRITLDEAGLTEVDAQFEIISRYDEDNDGAEITDKIRTVMVVFEATVSLASSTTYYLQVNPSSGTGGDADGVDILSNKEGYHQIATGNLTARITESAGFNLFDKITVDGVDIVSGPSSDGVILVSGGTRYTSYNSNDAPVMEIIYNGPLFALLKVSSHVEDSGNNPLIPTGTPNGVNPVSFDVFYWTYKEERIIHTGFRLKNNNPGYTGYAGQVNSNTIIDHLSLKTTLSGLATITEVDFSDWSDTTSPTGTYAIQQDHCLPGTCAQASEADTETTPNFNYYIKEGVTTQHTGRRFDSYAQMRDANRGIMVSQEYHWQNWPNDIEFDTTDKTATIYLLPDEPYNHTFLGASWKYWNVQYNFHANVAQDYNFNSELANVKKPLKILLGDQVATSKFYGDYTYPFFDITAVGRGGESLNTAKTEWENTILSAWNSGYNTQPILNESLTEKRERRDISSTIGAYDGPMDMYGWLKLGDFILGPGDSTNYQGGQGALNYEWNYLFILNAHKYQKYGMLSIGEQMSLKTGDQLTIHCPVDDNTAISGSGGTVKRAHGGHVGEWDGDTALRNYQQHNIGYDRTNWMHGHPQGIIYEYGLTGKPWLKDALDDLGDFLRYNYSRITPDHGAFGAQPYESLDCVTGNPTYHIFLEVRAYVRSMGMAVGLYQLTGDIDYYNIAAGIFNNVLIQSEDPPLSGYLRTNNNYPNYSPWYTIQSFKYNMMLFHAAKESNDTETETAISDFMIRSAQWFYRMSQEDQVSPAGVYDGGNYTPYTMYQYWTEDAGFSGAERPENMTELADLYAFAHEQTNDPSWLAIARDNFKDPWYYTEPFFYVKPDETKPINIVSVESYGLGRGITWMKAGKNLVRPMYYINMEYDLQQKKRPLILKIINKRP